MTIVVILAIGLGDKDIKIERATYLSFSAAFSLPILNALQFFFFHLLSWLIVRFLLNLYFNIYLVYSVFFGCMTTMTTILNFQVCV